MRHGYLTRKTLQITSRDARRGYQSLQSDRSQRPRMSRYRAIMGGVPGKFGGVCWKSRQNERILGKMGKG